MSEVHDAEFVEEGQELVPTSPSTLFRTDDGELVLDRAIRLAEKLAPIVRQKGMCITIQGKDYALVEAWQTLGSMLGVTPVTVWTRRLTDPQGWEARVEARTLDGRVVGAAEAECLVSEERWASAEDYARRSMAQTRATSKALSSVLRFVMTLGGFSGTPAEEMDGVKQSSGFRSGAALKPSDKQLAFLEKLLKDRPQVGADDLPLVMAFCRDTLTGGRDGTCSETIEALKGKDERAAKTALALVQRAREAASRETDVPAEQEDLSALIDADPGSPEDVPF